MTLLDYGLSVGSLALSGGAMMLIFSQPTTAAVISIVAAHELAHFFAGLVWGEVVRPPFFIPLGIGLIGATYCSTSSPEAKARIAISGPVVGSIVASTAYVIRRLLFRAAAPLPALGIMALSQIASLFFSSDASKYRHARKEHRI